MSIFDRLMGYPEPDPKGKSRDLFEKVGNQAMTMFFRGDIERALRHPLELERMVTGKFNSYHPDVGRARLLYSVMLTMLTRYDEAFDSCGDALDVLEDCEEVAEVDLEAAEFLKDGLMNLLDGERPVRGEDNYLISRETVLGKWLWRLRE